MLEDDVRSTTQQVLVTSQPAKNDSTKGSKTTSQRRQMGKGQDGQQHSNQANLILNISYEKLLPMICELSDFNWLKPIKMDLAKRDRSIKCAYHKEQSNTKVSTI